MAPSTVSKALRNDPRISATTRARIRALADEIDFTPNTAAQSLTTGRTMTVGLVVHDYADPYNGVLVRAVESTALRAGYQLLVASTEGADRRDVDLVRQFRRYRVDGVILVASHMLEHKALADLDVPVVFIVEKPELLPQGDKVGLVTFDEVGAFRLGVQHLLGLGHRRIGYVGIRHRGASGTDRQLGYETGLRAAGIEPDRNLTVFPTSPNPADAGAQGIGLLLPHEPTAIMFYNDVAAYGGIRALLDQGLRVPEDISVVGFDDLEMSALITPPLTTVAQPREDIGRLAMDLAVHMMAGDAESLRITTGCTLTVRRSTAAPRLAARQPT